jgi:hypothetical protein
MRVATAALLATLLSVCCLNPTPCLAQNERERSVRDDKQTLALDDAWIYDDLHEAMANATAAGKPVMVLIRCLP